MAWNMYGTNSKQFVLVSNINRKYGFFHLSYLAYHWRTIGGRSIAGERWFEHCIPIKKRKGSKKVIQRVSKEFLFQIPYHFDVVDLLKAPDVQIHIDNCWTICKGERGESMKDDFDVQIILLASGHTKFPLKRGKIREKPGNVMADDDYCIIHHWIKPKPAPKLKSLTGKWILWCLHLPCHITVPLSCT